mmetsp:Transcript_46184/g.51494  ORF Transcript_46184/g.51494 Transcript_46184/m.51494 type:complete len:90 (+) Transcript_46184:276-545(+)
MLISAWKNTTMIPSQEMRKRKNNHIINRMEERERERDRKRTRLRKTTGDNNATNYNVVERGNNKRSQSSTPHSFRMSWRQNRWSLLSMK